MPYAIRFPIGGSDRPPPARLYRALYANLLQWVDTVDAELAAEVHARPVRKPFTISGLFQDREGGWCWRTTILEDDLFEAVWTGVQVVGEIDLNGRRWPVRWPDSLITHQSYDFMLTEVQPSSRIRMRFLSPTTFRHGEMDYPLPEPTTVFRSWMSRWNDFAPAGRRLNTDLLDVVRSNVAISAHDIRTGRHDLGHSQIVGFVGQVTYEIVNTRRLNQSVVWQLNALADYAEFCSTGRKTTHGMGQTRRSR